MKNTSLITFSLFSLILVTSCAQKTKTSNVAAATGGALGAAIGAMVGNQTGSAAGGLLVGGAAGAGTGLAIGRSLEGQENEIANQREAIVRQNKVLSAQQAELDELKRLSSDKISYKNNSYNNTNSIYNKPTYESGELAKNIRANIEDSNQVNANNSGSNLRAMTAEERLRRLRSNSNSTNNIERTTRSTVRPRLPAYKEQDIIASNNRQTQDSFRERSVTKLNPVQESKRVESKVLYDLESNQKKLNKNGEIIVSNLSANTIDTEDARGALNTDRTIIKNLPSQKSIKKDIIIEEEEVTEECGEAKKEYSSALSSNQIADKLFHYRRALRLCPNHAGYHTGLGKVYLSLNRFEDAKYEFKQALVIDPNFKSAKEQLASIE